MSSHDPKSIYDERRVLPIRYYTNKNYNNTRRTRVILIGIFARQYPAFKKLPEDTQDEIIEAIERSCYNETCNSADDLNTPRNWKNDEFQALYKYITHAVQKGILYEADKPSSEYLIKKIVDGDIDPNIVGTLKPHEIYPEKTKTLHEMIETRRNVKYEKKYNTTFTCPVCGGKKTTVVVKNMRSLDEGADMRVTCAATGCNTTWKEGCS